MELNFKQQIKQLLFAFEGLWKPFFYSKQTLAFVILCSGTVTLLPAQNWDQIIKSVAADRAIGDYFGSSVAISGDYAIVGAPREDEDAAGNATVDDAGAAYIFKWTGTTWVQESKIVAADRAAYDNFGISVAISGDYAIVGAYQEDEDAAGGSTASDAGAAYIFKRTGTTWTQEAKIVAADRALGDNFGYSVAISGDYAIVGAHWENENATGGATASDAGAAYIFKRTGTTWAQEAKIVAADRAAFDYFGYSVAISGDYAIVGAYREDHDAAGSAMANNAGSAYIFKRTGTTWAQEAKIVAADRAAEDYFGISVAISGDYAIVGAYQEDEDAAGGATASDAGAAYIFKRTGTTWAQEAKIVAADRADFDYFGWSVAISENYAMVGAIYEDEDAAGGATVNGAGSAYIFKRTGTIWAQEAKIVAADRAEDDVFGSSVAISGNYAMVGAYFEDEDAAGGATATDAGSVYFYQKPVVLPIELLSFSGKNTADGNALSWATAHEVDNKGFEVQRLNGSDWENIGFVNAINKAAHYQFMDNKPLSTSYYRLKQIDNSGKFQYSKIISIVQENKGKGLSIYPNPASSTLNFITDDVKFDYQIINTNGQTILNGRTNYQIDISNLPKGSYWLKVGNDITKFIKQ